jgi:nucleotide-binding universal stress UspA family protein
MKDRAVTLAREWGAKLSFVYAIDVAGIPCDDVNEATAEIARRKTYRLLRAQVGSAGDVMRGLVSDEGNAADVVLKAAQMEGADLIVTATAGFSPLGQLLPGSTTARLVAYAKVPVLVMKKRGVPRYARIVVATDLSDASVAGRNCDGVVPAVAGHALPRLRHTLQRPHH